jgi:hypothetical protein
MTVVALLFRFTLAAVFLHAGVVKMIDLGEFRLAVRNYRLVPERLLGPLVLALPLAELACAALLVVGIGTGPVAALLVILLAVFVGAISVNLLRGRTFSCGCSGRTSSDITWRHVIVNAVLAVMAVQVSFWAAQPLTVAAGWGLHDSSSLTPGQAAAVLMAAATTAVLVLLVRETLIVRRAISARRRPVGDSAGPVGEVTG